MAIRVQRHANVSKQATLLDGLDVSPLKWRVSGYCFNRFVHEGMNHISNVEVHFKTRSGNVNIRKYIYFFNLTLICRVNVKRNVVLYPGTLLRLKLLRPKIFERGGTIIRNLLG